MISISIDAAIKSFEETLLPRFSPVDEVLGFRIRIITYRNEVSSVDLFDVVIYRPRNYTLVGYKKSNELMVNYSGDYITTAHHDSTWWSDGFSFFNYGYGITVDHVSIDEIKKVQGSVIIHNEKRMFSFQKK